MTYITDHRTVPPQDQKGSYSAWRRLIDLVRVVGVWGFFAVAVSGLLPSTDWSSHPELETEVAIVGIIIGIVIWLVNIRRGHQH